MFINTRCITPVILLLLQLSSLGSCQETTEGSLASLTDVTPPSPPPISSPNEPLETPTATFTADSAREQNGDLRENENGEEKTPQEELEELGGFVEPIDFEAEFNKPLKKKKKAKSSFEDFFNSDSGDKRKTSYLEPSLEGFGFGEFPSSSNPNKKTRKHKEDFNSYGDPREHFTDPFSSTEPDEFDAEDFIRYKPESESLGGDLSKTSQSRTTPYTYSGRVFDDDYGPTENSRYRSSYRQPSRSRSPSPYSDLSYYDGHSDSSPLPPPNPRERERGGGGGRESRERESYEETPEEKGTKAKASENAGKKCKKITKQVEVNEEEDFFGDPSADYDPANYESRYKRQNAKPNKQAATAKNKKKTRPMTCNVCLDENGRYAETCNYDSSGDPGKGSYFHSSSSSYSDNDNNKNNKSPSSSSSSGGGGKSKGDRYRRNLKIESSASGLSTRKVSAPPPVLISLVHDEPEEKKIEKRQTGDPEYIPRPHPHSRNLPPIPSIPSLYPQRSPPQRHSSPFPPIRRPAYSERQERLERPERQNRPPNRFFSSQEGREGPIGNEQRQIESQEEFPPPSGRRQGGYDEDGGPYGPGVDYGPRNSGSDGRGYDNYGFPLHREESRGSGRNSNYDIQVPNYEGDAEVEAPNEGLLRDSGAYQSGSNAQFRDFNFGIPRDFDPDVQVGASSLSGRRSSSPDRNEDYFGPSFDIGYEDYVKKYFPEVVPASGSGGSRDVTGPSEEPAASYNAPSGPSEGHSPQREHTEEQRHYAPAPYYGPQEQEEYQSNEENLNRHVGTFEHKDRRGCQKMNKGGMTCYVCIDPRGMKKQECMYKNDDPTNQRVAYHEVAEYSSPKASIVPLKNPKVNEKVNITTTHQTAPLVQSESKIIEKKTQIVDYDFDY